MTALHGGHQIALLQGGQEYFAALIAAIDAARMEVRVETYIFDFDAEHGVSSIAVARALVRAAERGVMVCLVVDGVGTPELPEAWARQFDQAGVLWHVYSPFGTFGLFNPRRWRRMHRKLAAVDGELAFCGGINLLDDHWDPNHGVLDAPRFDFAVRLQGPVVAQVRIAMLEQWRRIELGRDMRAGRYRAALHGWRDVLPGWRRARRSAAQGVPGDIDNARAGLLLRDNLRNRNRIENAYLAALARARREAIVANAYFLPGRKLRRALLAAARRGVRVTLLLQGKYEYFMQYHGAQPVYGQLLAAGIELVEYAPSFLHAKVAVIDADHPQAWSTVGSSNLDPLSLLLAREANVVIEGPAFATELRRRLRDAIAQDGQRVDPQAYARRGLLRRGLDWAAYGLMRLALWLTGRRY